MGPRDTRGITLAIDIGGTFTNAVLYGVVISAAGDINGKAGPRDLDR
jgi:hypothetical protein